MRVRASLLASAAVLLAAACVTETKLQPLPTAPTTQNGSVVAEDQGVRLVANGAAWKGNPSNLERIVTPVEVRIENQSGRPLRIDLKNFALVGDSHFQYSALSPYQLRGQYASAEGPGVGGSGGVAAPVAFSVGVAVHGPYGYGWRHGPYSRGYAWGGWGWGRGWYDPWYDPFFGPYPYRVPEPLPTRDMLKRSLPEGQLENGGTVTGFLYFQDVSEREGRVTLQARLVDASTGEQFGTLAIPFDVRG